MISLILSRRDFREYDQIISVYTREEGKRELLARGVKKITSKNSAHVEPFSVVDIEIARGKEIDHVTKVQPVEYFSHIRNDLQKSLAAMYVVSLLNTLLREKEKDERIFDNTFSWLSFLDQCNHTQESVKSVLDGLIVTLLHCLGFSMLQNSDVEKWKSMVQVMENGDWNSVVQLQYDEQLHKKIHEFLVYQTEQKVSDWTEFQKGVYYN